MDAIKRCTRCILPESLKETKFDSEGVCNHCRKYEQDFKEWDSIQLRKEKEFEKILDKAKKLRRPYDCLVPLSGGKDSTYALYLATKVYKLKTLAISLDNSYLSNPAKENIKNALAHCNADHIYYTLSRENTAELFKVFVENTGDFCNACMRGINYSIEFATKAFDIPLVIKGSGRRVQYVSQIKEVSSLNTASYFANVIKKSQVKDDFGHFARHKQKLEIQKILGGVTDIAGISRTTLMRFVPQHIGMYDYIYKPYPEIISIIKNEMGWSDGAGKAEHLDCELHDIPFYMNTLRINNITKNTFYYSGLIRQGIMTREEALKKEEEELKSPDKPIELIKFLSDNKIANEDYKNYVLHANKTQYEPRFQKLARSIYHKFRRF
ncbi:MAG TPA: hypothetical protein PK784_06820 [Tenuifilaceae bacterium]|nr:hypothetical protein [Tenuifilaceae bacterium]HPN23202.1 hypothetical protein [Tenuifilaceae bacterium]